MYRQLLPILLLLLCTDNLIAHDSDDAETIKCKCECQQCDQREEHHDIPYVPHGIYGLPGQSGQPGIPGTPGVNGNHGIPGATGIQGRKGERGPKGMKGDTCQLGQTLPQEQVDCTEVGNCSTGSPGQKGEQGLPGLPGVNIIRPRETAKVAFSAGRTKTMTSQEPGTVITFDTLFVNAGQDFDKDTGIFTCRVNGTYYFVMHVANFYDVGDNNLYVQLLYNDKHIVSVYHHDDSTYRDSVSNSVVLQLVRSDQVKLYLEGNRHLYSSSRRFTTFSGYILFADD